MMNQKLDEKIDDLLSSARISVSICMQLLAEAKKNKTLPPRMKGRRFNEHLMLCLQCAYDSLEDIETEE